MSEFVSARGDHRTHVKSALMRESLLDKSVISSSDTDQEIRILPDVNIVAMGGRSILDRGRDALLPMLDEIVHCRKRYQIILGVGGGARLRHTYHICLDLGIPTGGLAMVAGAVDEQNTRMVQSLLAKNKGITLNKDHFLDLPLWLEAGMIPIMAGMPPYHYWEPPTGEDRIPSHGEDLGMFMVSEVLGARSMIFVKDEDGLFTADPKKDRKARLIPFATAAEVLEMNLPDLVIERVVIETMMRARHTRTVQIINGLRPELLRRALAGEHVGTIITADEAPPQRARSPKAGAAKKRNDGKSVRKSGSGSKASRGGRR